MFKIMVIFWGIFGVVLFVKGEGFQSFMLCFIMAQLLYTTILLEKIKEDKNAKSRI